MYPLPYDDLINENQTFHCANFSKEKNVYTRGGFMLMYGKTSTIL